MPAINFQHNLVIDKDRDSAVQTTLSGSTVYTLPKLTSKRCMVDLVLMIMDEDGPIPMSNMRSTKKKRNAADQFDDEHQGQYEAMGQPTRNQIDQVHTHNNAFPKMYDELEKRRSIALTATSSSHQNATAKFDPTCPKCVKRKKRLEQERKKKGQAAKKFTDKRMRKQSSNKLSRINKQRVLKPRKRQSRCRSTLRGSRPCVIGSDKCFQCYIAAETKSVSTFKSNHNLLTVPQESTPPNLPGFNIIENHEKIENSKSSHKKRFKKPGSLKSDANPDSETGASVSSFNSFMSMEHEPMVE